MNKVKIIFVVIIAFALVGLPAVASAQHAYRRSEQQVKGLLERLDSDSDRFRRSVDNALDKSPIDGSKDEDNINQLMRDFHVDLI